MLNCESCQNLIADALFEDLDLNLAEQMNAHLQTCDDCQSIFEEMVEASEQFQTWSDSHPHFGSSSSDQSDLHDTTNSGEALWRRLQPELNRIDAERYRKLPNSLSDNLPDGTSPHKKARHLWSYGVVAAASVILMVSVITTFILPGDSEQNTPVPVLVSVPATNPVNPALANYLDRAQVMLQLVANAESSATLPIGKIYAESMALEANIIRASVEETSNAGQLALLRDVQFMLLQISNLDDSNMAAGIEILQQYLEENIVLFRIRLLEMRKETQIQPVSDVI